MLHFTLVRWGPDAFHKLALSVLTLKIFFTYFIHATRYRSKQDNQVSLGSLYAVGCN